MYIFSKKIPKFGSSRSKASTANSYDSSADGKSKSNTRQGCVVMACCIIAMALGPGIVTTYGVYQDEYDRQFEHRDTLMLPVIGIGIVQLLFAHLFRFASYAATNRLGPRPVVLAGGILISMGLGFSSLSQEIWHLYITQGVMTGLGISLIWYPATNTPPMWFSRGKRAIATSFVWSGVGLGTTMFSLLTRYFLEHHEVPGFHKWLAVLTSCLAIPASVGVLMPTMDFSMDGDEEDDSDGGTGFRNKGSINGMSTSSSSSSSTDSESSDEVISTTITTTPSTSPAAKPLTTTKSKWNIFHRTKKPPAPRTVAEAAAAAAARGQPLSSVISIQLPTPEQQQKEEEKANPTVLKPNKMLLKEERLKKRQMPESLDLNVVNQELLKQIPPKNFKPETPDQSNSEINIMIEKGPVVRFSVPRPPTIDSEYFKEMAIRDSWLLIHIPPLKLLTEFRFWILSLSLSLVLASWYINVYFLPSHTVQLNLGASKAALAISVTGITFCLGTIILPFITRHLVTVINLIIIVSSLNFLSSLLLWVSVTSIAEMFVFAGLAGIVLGMFYQLIPLVAKVSYPNMDPQVVCNFCYFVMAAVIAIAFPGAYLVFETLGKAHHYSVIFEYSSALCIIGVVLFVVLRLLVSKRAQQ